MAAMLGKYELHEQLGRGGFGTVYRAVDTTLQREVALKVLHPQLTTDPDFLERFQNEARLTASLDNAHIVPIFELAETDGRVFIAMKFLPGGSLKQRLEKGGAIPFDETLKIIKEVCSGLEAAHKKGLVHRDVKPANILFDGEGKAVIGDFGLARAVQLSSATAASSAAGGAGTPAYRAPELWRGKPPARPATDVYSIGCVLFEMLTGKILFDGETPDEIIAQHLVDGPNLDQTFPPSIPKGILQVLLKALAKDPLARYQKMGELTRALSDLLSTAGWIVRSRPDGYLDKAKNEQKKIPDLPADETKDKEPITVREFVTEQGSVKTDEMAAKQYQGKSRLLGFLKTVFIANPFMGLLFLSILVGGSVALVLLINSTSPTEKVSPEGEETIVSEISTADMRILSTIEVPNAILEPIILVSPTNTPDFIRIQQEGFTRKTQMAKSDPEGACWLDVPFTETFPNKDFCDSFDQESERWIRSFNNFDNGSTTETDELSGGSYLVNWKGEIGSTKRIQLMGIYKDFELLVNIDGNQIGNDSGKAGLFFRGSNNGYYVFTLDQASYSVAYYDSKNDVWISILENRLSNIKQDSYWLGVIANGNQVEFYINRENVGRMENDLSSQGEIGLIVEMGENSTTSIKFNDFAVLTPLCNPIDTALISINMSNFEMKYDQELLRNATFVFNKPSVSGVWELVFQGDTFDDPSVGVNEVILPCYVDGKYLYCGSANIFSGTPHLVIRQKIDKCEVYQTTVTRSFMKYILDLAKKRYEK